MPSVSPSRGRAAARVAVIGVLTALAVVAIGVMHGSAATPQTQSVAVPSKAGQTVTVSWSGTIPAASPHPTNTCNGPGVGSDDEGITVTVPRKGYDRFDAVFTFQITWTPSNPTGDESLNDEVLTVNSADNADPGDTNGSEVGSSDGGTTQETVIAHNLAPGTYHALACGFVNSTPQPYQGTLTVQTVARAASKSLPSANAQGLSFSAAVPADPQRDEAEPLIEISRDGHIYTCGPTRVSNGADYAQVSTDGAAANGAITSTGVPADRQGMTCTDAHTVLLSWNQQEPRNVVVQKSTDGGLTYSPITSVAAPDPEFPGPLRYIPSLNTVYMPWTKGEQVNLAVSHDGGATWTDCKVASGPTVTGGTAGFAVADHDSAGNVYVVWADSSNFHTWMSVVTADKLAACNQSTDDVAAADDGEPTVDPGFSAPMQVDRDAVRTTVFPWVAAGGAPGRVAVTFYGTTSDGDPNSGDFKGAWNVYVNQSLNALSTTRTISQVQATTHPFHYDSICLNGLGCDLAVPPGDRTLADFFAIGYDPVDGRLSVVFNRDNKKPDEPLGHIGTPMVATQIAGPAKDAGTGS